MRILTAWVVLLLLGSPVQAENKERFWILWENIEEVAENCRGAGCQTRRNYISRLFEPQDRQAVYRLFGLLDFHAAVRGRAAEHPDAPRICQRYDAEVVLGFDPERFKMAGKTEALRDLKGVRIDVRNMRAPAAYQGDFGGRLQSEIESRFYAAGIRILSAEQVMTTPGQPKLNIYFSNANLKTGCTYSVFASLSQTVILTRDVRIKISAGTWAYSTGPLADYPDATEYDAILRVADAFVKDYLKANSGGG